MGNSNGTKMNKHFYLFSKQQHASQVKSLIAACEGHIIFFFFLSSVEDEMGWNHVTPMVKEVCNQIV